MPKIDHDQTGKVDVATSLRLIARLGTLDDTVTEILEDAIDEIGELRRESAALLAQVQKLQARIKDLTRAAR